MTLRYPDSVSPEVGEQAGAPGIPRGKTSLRLSYESRSRCGVKGVEEKGVQAEGIL